MVLVETNRAAAADLFVCPAAMSLATRSSVGVSAAQPNRARAVAGRAARCPDCDPTGAVATDRAGRACGLGSRRSCAARRASSRWHTRDRLPRVASSRLRAWPRTVPEPVLGHLQDRRGAQRFEHHPLTRRELATAGVVMAAGGAVHPHDGGVVQQVGQLAEHPPGGGIEPVPVVDRDQQRMPGRVPAQEPLQQPGLQQAVVRQRSHRADRMVGDHRAAPAAETDQQRLQWGLDRPLGRHLDDGHPSGRDLGAQVLRSSAVRPSPGSASTTTRCPVRVTVARPRAPLGAPSSVPPQRPLVRSGPPALRWHRVGVQELQVW